MRCSKQKLCYQCACINPAQRLQRSNLDCTYHKATGNIINQCSDFNVRDTSSLSDHFGLFISQEHLYTLRRETKGPRSINTLHTRQFIISQNIPIIKKEKGIILQPVSYYSTTVLQRCCQQEMAKTNEPTAISVREKAPTAGRLPLLYYRCTCLQMKIARVNEQLKECVQSSLQFSMHSLI